MAEIMSDIRGAVRRGLYAARSMRKPSSAVATMTSGSAMYIGMDAEAYTMMSPATMNTSPWAKLMSRRMP